MVDRETPESVAQFASFLHQKRLAAPALLLLEAHVPCRAIFHTMTIALEPLLGPLVGFERIEKLQQVLSSPEHIEALLSALDEQPAPQRFD